jgi:GTP cyclohydrolase I
MSDMTPPDDDPRVHAARLIAALNFPDDPEMADTPRRLVEWLSRFTSSGGPPSLSLCATRSTAPVVMRGVPFHSVCAHHLLPFFGTADIAYRPAGQLAGLGSLSRAVTHFAARPQVQERLGEQVAEHLAEALKPQCLVVRLTARQLCVELTQGMQPTVVTEATVGTPDPHLLSLLEPR